MNWVFHSILLLTFYWQSPVVAQTDSSEAKLRTIADNVLKDATFQFVDSKSGRRLESLKNATPEMQLRPESQYTDWRYWNGVINLAMLRLGETLNERTYTEFPVRNVAFGFDNYRFFQQKHTDEDKWNYPYGQFFILKELDDCGAMGASVIEVNKINAQSRYKEYIEKAAAHMLSMQSRLGDGTFVRSFPQKWTLWADDLYMSIVFLARMGGLKGEARYFDDAARQVINFHKYLFDETKGLMHHCWYSDTQTPGVAFWGRANGWVLLAQADLLDRLPQTHSSRDTLIRLFRRHLLGIATYQTASGLWRQLLDKPDSYEETSCSAMFTYAFARAVNAGFIESHYATITLRGWEGVSSKIRSNGQVEGVCAGTVVSDDLVHYYRRPTPMNDIHGIGAVLLAGTEILLLQRHQSK